MPKIYEGPGAWCKSLLQALRQAIKGSTEEDTVNRELWPWSNKSLHTLHRVLKKRTGENLVCLTLQTPRGPVTVSASVVQKGQILITFEGKTLAGYRDSISNYEMQNTFGFSLEFISGLRHAVEAQIALLAEQYGVTSEFEAALEDWYSRELK